MRDGAAGSVHVANSLEVGARTRELAMERWVLGGSTPLRIGALWLAGVTVLVGVQLLLGRNSPHARVG